MVDANIITKADFQAYAPEVDLSQYNDPTISGMIAQSSKMVADYLEYTPMAETITDEVKTASITTDGDLLIFPAKLPIISVSAIKISKGATDIALTLQDGNGNNKYNIDYTNRHIRYPYGEITLQGVPVFTNFYALRGNQFYTKLTYRAGYEAGAVPADIILATVLFTREILSRKNNTSGATRISQGGLSLDFGQRNDKSDLVRDAERLLNSYRRIG